MAEYNNSSETRVVVDGTAFAAFFQQKIQKISHALYMVTSYIPEGEPLRFSIRRVALEMIDALHENDLYGGSSVSVSFEPLFRQTTSYLSISKTMGYISPMNCDILTSEVSALSGMVSDDLASTRGLLSKDFFSVPAPTLPEKTAGSNPSQNVSYNNLPSSVQGQDSNYAKPKGQKAAALLKRQEQSQNSGAIKDTSSKKNHSVRQEKILDLFKTGKETITVNDVEKAIHGCSKKTMQRELLTLVEEGYLLKEGEKRWSEYRLAQKI